ncbi:unnamed protein product, partial [Staurois parvus]
HLPDHCEGWGDLPVWNPGNIENGNISLVGSHYWIHLPDDGKGWCDLPVWNPGHTEDGDISVVLTLLTPISTYLMMRDHVIFLCGIPGIQRLGTSVWWVPIIGSI